MVQRIMMFPSKHDDLNSIPRNHTVKRDKQLKWPVTYNSLCANKQVLKKKQNSSSIITKETMKLVSHR